MNMELTLTARGDNGRNSYLKNIPIDEINLLLHKYEQLHLPKLPSFRDCPHPALMIWETIQDMKGYVEPSLTSGNAFNSYDPTKNDQGYPITVAPDVPAV